MPISAAGARSQDKEIKHRYISFALAMKEEEEEKEKEETI